VSHCGERRFRIRQLPVNLRFCLPRGVVGGALGLPVSAFLIVLLGAEARLLSRRNDPDFLPPNGGLPHPRNTVITHLPAFSLTTSVGENP